MKAVMIPKMPPAFVMSLSSLNSPMVSRRKVMDSEKKRVVRHTFVRKVANHIMKVKMVQPSSQSPKDSLKSTRDSLATNAARTPKAGIWITANESQNAPYDENAVAPKVFPAENSHIPARSCANPPYPAAKPVTTVWGALCGIITPALWQDSTNVVKANPMSPRGAGFATTDLVCMGLDRMSSNRDAFSISRSCVGYDIVDMFSVLQKTSSWLCESWSKELKLWRGIGWEETHSHARCHRQKRDWMSRLLILVCLWLPD